MNLSYNTHFNPPSPYTQQQRSSALAGLSMQNPYKEYGQQQQDILDAAGGANAAAFDMASTKANTDFEMDKLKSQQQLSLAGLQQMAEARQQEGQLANQRLGNATSFLSPLLSGLF